MRYPKNLEKGGTIGFIAPSFGCTIEPYKTRFENAIRIFKEMGYNIWLGPNCYEESGIGISNKPSLCGEELNAAMTDENLDAIITCGGGELMCEVVPYIDFDRIKKADPKWYMGYSDNTNFTFLSAILADTAAIYGPCAPTFGREPWHSSISDALNILTGESDSVKSYELWEKYELEDGDSDTDQEGSDESDGMETADIDPIAPYNVTEPVKLMYHLPSVNGQPVSSENGKSVSSENIQSVLSGDELSDKVEMSGRLLGGCLDILILLAGTKYDKVGEFLEKYKDDGFIWFLESCDLNNLSMRRAYWQLREAGWFKYVKGFLIGRPRIYGEDIFGVDQYNAVSDILGELNVPIIMDLDIGHLPPMMPIITGSKADITAAGNEINIKYRFD